MKSYSHSNVEEREQEINANNLVMSSLTNLRVYRLRDGYVYMYFVGKTENQDWIIIRTKASET